MAWLKDYWWIMIILLLLLGVVLNAIRDLQALDYKKYLEKKNIKPRQYDDEDD